MNYSTSRNRVMTYLSVTKKAWKNASHKVMKIVYSRSTYCSDYRSLHNVRIILRFGCLQSTYSLFVQYLNSEH